MERQKNTGEVSFVGAGPGAVDLLTIRGAKAIAEADLVLYAGSLVSREICALARKEAIICDSASMTLEETHAMIVQTSRKNGKTARVHTGDPSMFGAIAEQIALLDADNIPWRIIPGVTAAMAAAAAAGISFSQPETAQSLILTRMAGRTRMPASENLAALASLGISMAVYLAGHKADELQEQLASRLPPDTRVICASRVSWPEEKIVSTTLDRLAETVKQHEIGKQTVFLILPANSCNRTRSRLYAGDFSHTFRPHE